MVATRMRDTAFKRVLKVLPIGSDIKINGPEGLFYLHKDISKPIVFLIGGIGITPVYSMLKNVAYQKLPINYFCFIPTKDPKMRHS